MATVYCGNYPEVTGCETKLGMHTFAIHSTDSERSSVSRGVKSFKQIKRTHGLAYKTFNTDNLIFNADSERDMLELGSKISNPSKDNYYFKAKFNTTEIPHSRYARSANALHCPDDSFHCLLSGTCISKLHVCDLKSDCPYLWQGAGEDELHCLDSECSSGAFRCKSGECMSYEGRCDGFNYCWDSSDEDDCQNSTCPPHYYRCDNGQCIPIQKRCDGNSAKLSEAIKDLFINTFDKDEDIINSLRQKFWAKDSKGRYILSDCLDGSDEEDCNTYACPPEHFKCANGQCVPLEARCDNNTVNKYYFIQDCSDGSDEEECETSECGDYFRCPNGQCLHPSSRCDNIVQCSDGRDEEGCPKDVDCPSNLLSCGNGRCVSYNYRCSGKGIWFNEIGNQCSWSIERNCPLSKCPKNYFRCRTGQCLPYNTCNRRDNPYFCDPVTDPVDHCGVTDCPKDYFQCDSGQCLHHVSVCDGIKDCYKGEDEQYCGNAQCRENQIDCGDGTCVPETLKCDLYNHCPNGADEAGCAKFYQELFSSSYLQCNSSSLVTSSLDIRSCSITCSKSCICKNGLVDCSSSLYTFPGALSNDVLWPFESISDQVMHPIYDGQAPLSRIYGLILSNSLLHTVPGGALRYTPYVQILDLSHNLLTHIISADFNNLYRLSKLDLSFNQIQTIDDFAFKGLRVFYLNLENNNIRHFGADMFGGMAADGTIRTDHLRFCCVKPTYLPADRCFPSFDLFSSCDDLMRDVHFRVLLWTIGVSATIGNLVVTLRRISNYRGSKRKSYGFFVLNLHLSDFLMGVYLLTIASADVHYRGAYIRHDVIWRESTACKSAGMLSLVSNESSALFAFFITIDRYIGVKHPFGDTRITFRASVAMTIAVWIFTTFLAIIPLLPWNYFQGEFYGSSAVCLPIPLTIQRHAGWQYAAAIYVGLNTLIFLSIAVGQFAIMKEIFAAKSKSLETSAINELNVAKSLMLIVLTDFLCWFPVCILSGLSLAGVYMTPDVYSWVAILVLPVNSAVNPLMYSLLIGKQ